MTEPEMLEAQADARIRDDPPHRAGPPRHLPRAAGTRLEQERRGGRRGCAGKGRPAQSLHRPPAVCFLDITGYTRLTEERGDEAAADLAAKLATLVRRSSQEHGGQAVKWLGDGVMFYFPDPGQGVLAALDMVEGVATHALPPAHVGIHAGPVVFQEGDYFGRTVNVAARIAEYARPGEVLVSQEVVDAADGTSGDVHRDRPRRAEGRIGRPPPPQGRPGRLRTGEIFDGTVRYARFTLRRRRSGRPARRAWEASSASHPAAPGLRARGQTVPRRSTRASRR